MACRMAYELNRRAAGSIVMLKVGPLEVLVQHSGHNEFFLILLKEAIKQ